MPSWVELLTLMVHGPDTTLRGVIRSRGGENSFGWTAYTNQARPVPAGAGLGGELAHVWRDGARARIAAPDGRPTLIVGDTTCWRFEPGNDVPVAGPVEAVRYVLAGTQLLVRRDANAFAGDDFTRPTGPVGATTFLGRPAWTVELAPPAHKPHPIQLVVDAETGIVLQQRNDGLGSVEEWVEFVPGEPLDPALFHWDGPERTEADERAAREAEHEAARRAQRRWFEANVAPLPLHVELTVQAQLHEWDERTGAFQASLGQHGMLARRPRSREPWELRWRKVQHRWSDERWDWAVTFYGEPPTTAGLAALRRQLGSP